MSVSAIFGSRVVVAPPSSAAARTGGAVQSAPTPAGGALVIECSSRPNKKATAHHMKTRPKKTQPWDIRRKPTVYPPLPALPPEWTLASSGEEPAGEAPPPPPPPPPPSTLQEAPPAS
ncbi:50S ribosomal protein 6, chloroplastic [Punica granatum]|nr:50S ribosomal protein 6, chloroplastic [Punica granatum]OWM80587.1 hypothetical protein CDL15_Pgr006617 [Punica granatum]